MINASGTDKLNLALDAGGAVSIDGFIHTNAGTFTSEGTTFRNTSQITTRGGAIDLSNHTGTITLIPLYQPCQILELELLLPLVERI